MPHYDYKCQACGHELEVQQEMTDDPLRECPKCHELKLRLIITGGLGFSLKGDGFYNKGRVNTDEGSESV